MAAVAPIGVYGFSGEAFLARLREAGIVMLLDVRQRRGVRDPPGLASLAVEGSFGEWPDHIYVLRQRFEEFQNA